jgi:hypothetical protein
MFIALFLKNKDSKDLQSGKKAVTGILSFCFLVCCAPQLHKIPRNTDVHVQNKYIITYYIENG